MEGVRLGGALWYTALVMARCGMFDLLIRNVLYQKRRLDVGVARGTFVAIEPAGVSNRQRRRR